MDSEALVKLVTMKMPYDKHAGRALADLHGNYLVWFAREGFPRGELGQLLELNAHPRSQWLTRFIGAHGVAPRTLG